MSTSRSGAAALLAALLLLPAAPASAATGITSPGADLVVTQDAVVPLRAVVEGPAASPSELSLQGPGARTAEVVAVSTDPGGDELAHDFDTACASRVCTERAPAANGIWTVRLSGASEDERTFVVRIAPAAPVDVAASRSEAGVLVRWAQGDEPDLRGYRVEDASGKVVRDRVGLDACDPERTCSVEVPEAAGAWSVRAYRATCPDCTELLASPPSNVVRAEDEQALLPVAPPPSAAPSPAPQPAARPDQQGAFLSAFGAARPAVRAAPPPAGAPAPVAPQAAGAYDQELGYGERELVVRAPQAPLSRAQDAVTDTLGTGNRWQLLVLSALMVGASVWLRRWTRRALAD